MLLLYFSQKILFTDIYEKVCCKRMGYHNNDKFSMVPSSGPIGQG